MLKKQKYQQQKNIYRRNIKTFDKLINFERYY